MNNIAVLLCLLIIMVLFVGCSEYELTHYATAVEAQQAGAFERGWLPQVLDEHVSDIEEYHDLDTNFGYATFRYTAQLVQRLRNTCTATEPNETIHGVFEPAWPDFLREPLTSAQLASRGIATFHCAGTPINDFMVAVDSRAHLGYMWHGGAN